MGINYGTNKVRFPSPVPVGSRTRGRFTVTAVEEIDGGVQLTLAGVAEREGQEKPVCAARGRLPPVPLKGAEGAPAEAGTPSRRTSRC